MDKIKVISSYLLLGLNILLVFIAAFTDQMQLPVSLQYLGKFHPVILHFPIVFIFLSAFVILWNAKNPIIDEKIILTLLFSTAIISTTTSILGVFLFQQGDYDENSVNLHKWMGVAISVASLVIYFLFDSFKNRKIISVMVLIQIPMIIIGSHEGGSLTHGEDFLSFNIHPTEEKKSEITDSSKIFAAFIEPILSSKCYSCHNERKAKGNLIMSNLNALLKGGKNGKLWENGDPLNSHIIQRANLNEEDEKHMPPKGKPQLTRQELDLLYGWISIGAPIDKMLSEFPITDSFRLLLNPFIPKETNISKVKFVAADPAIIEKLQNAHTIIRKQSIESPALQVRFSIREGFKTNFISDLKPISEQITDINCSNMPLTDSSILLFSMFPNLENININGTGIGNKGLENLIKIKSLRKISLSNNPVDGNALKLLLQLPKLKQVYCWSTLADSTYIATLSKANPSIEWEKGYISDSNELLQLTMPMLSDPELFILSKKDAVQFKHPMPGVSIKYTIDGSTPDSVKSPNYLEPIRINQPTRIRSIAVKKGWLTSDTTDHYFFPKSDTPVFARLITLPDDKYKSEGVRTLYNAKKGSLNNLSENWLGYKNGPLDVLFMFSKEQSFHEILISALKKTGPYVMPPEKIELWAGNDSTTLMKVFSLSPKQPSRYDADLNEIYHLPIKIKGRFFRIKVFPVAKLPKWHSGKGDKAWTFVDEFFFY